MLCSSVAVIPLLEGRENSLMQLVDCARDMKPGCCGELLNCLLLDKHQEEREESLRETFIGVSDI